VRCPYRDQGVAGRLLQAAEDWGRRHGAEFGLLEYHTANTRAGKFYRQMRYRLASITVLKLL
jgi:GNAT superfamily N-acetyltransferase